MRMVDNTVSAFICLFAFMSEISLENSKFGLKQNTQHFTTQFGSMRIMPMSNFRDGKDDIRSMLVFVPACLRTCDSHGVSVFG